MCSQSPEAGTSPPPSPLQSTSAALRHKIRDKLATINPQHQLSRLSRDVSSDRMLEDANRALRTIPSTMITQTSVILEMLGYTIKKNSSTYPLPPWKMRLETRSREFKQNSQLVELKKALEIKNKNKS